MSYNNKKDLIDVLGSGNESGTYNIIMGTSTTINTSNGSSYLALDNAGVVSDVNLSNGTDCNLYLAGDSSIASLYSITQARIESDGNTNIIAGANVSLGIQGAAESEIEIISNGVSSATSTNIDKKAVLVGTKNSTINSAVVNSVVLGGQNITATQSNTAYVDKLNIKTLGTSQPVQTLGIDAGGFIVIGTSSTGVGGATPSLQQVLAVGNDSSSYDIIMGTSTSIKSNSVLRLNTNVDNAYIELDNTTPIMNLYSNSDVNITADNGTINTIGNIIMSSGTITVNNSYTLPLNDGSSNQVLTTNGSGIVSWTTITGGATPSLSQALAVGNTASNNINIGTYSLTNGSNNNLHLDYLTSTYLYNGSSPTNYNSLVFVNSSQVKIESYSSPLGNTFSTIISAPTSVQMSLNSGFIDYTRVIISNTNNKVGIITNLDSYYFPRVDGISGQVLMTDGSGDLYWGTASASLSSRLTAWDAYNTNGLVAQTSATTWTNRTITSGGNPITITNGDGVSGNPTINFNGSYTGTFTASAGLVTQGNITADDFIQNSSASLETTNATLTTLKTIATTSEYVYHLEITVIGGLTTTANGYTMKMFLSYKNNGGTLSQIGYGNFFQDSDWAGTTPNAAVNTSGANILIQVTGLAGTNIDWYCYAIVRSAPMGVI